MQNDCKITDFKIIRFDLEILIGIEVSGELNELRNRTDKGREDEKLRRYEDWTNPPDRQAGGKGIDFADRQLDADLLIRQTLLKSQCSN